MANNHPHLDKPSLITDIDIRDFNEPEDITFAALTMQQEKWFNETTIEVKNNAENPSVLCLIASKGNQKAGIVMAMMYEEYAVISNLIVIQSLRRQGIGTQLLHKIIERIQVSNIESIILEGKESNITFFEKFGFQKATRVIHFFGDVPPENHFAVSKISNQDLPLVFEIDKNVFGADRSFYLRMLMQNYPQLALKYSENDKTLAYLFARVGLGGYISAGPLVDLTAGKGALALLRSFQEMIGFQPFQCSVFAWQQHAVGALIELGLKPDPETSYLMIRGQGAIPTPHSGSLLLGPHLTG